MCVAGYVLMSVGRVHQLFPGLELVHPAVLLGLLGILLYVLDKRSDRRAARLLVPTTKCLALLLFWMILAIPDALRPGNSVALVFNNFVKTALMYMVVAGSVRGVRDVERLAMTYLAGAVIYSAVVVLRFNLGTGDAWRLGKLYYYDANDFATFVVTAIPFGVYFLHAGRRPAIRFLAGVALGILTLGFVWSGSRGGFIALLAVALFIVARYSAIPLRWRVGATALVAVVLLGTASDRYWEQMGTITSDDDYNHTSETGRLQIWSRGLDYMLENPILGVGPDNFPVAEGTLSPFAERQQWGIGVRWNAAHNAFIQIGAELGLPGLVLFISIIACAFAALRRAGRNESRAAEAGSQAARVTPALTASLLGFVVGAFFLSLAYSEMLYTLIAFAVALEKVTFSPACAPTMAQPVAAIR